MLELGMNDVMIFFVTVGICLSFVIIWIMKAESRRNIFKDEITRLKSRIEASDREKFVLSEKIDSLEKNQFVQAEETSGDEKSGLKKNAVLLIQALKQNEELGKENKKLKLELDEAKMSMEEIYKALVEKK